MNYNTENHPEYLSKLREQFTGSEIQAVSAKGTLWSLQQEDVVLKGERDFAPSTKGGGSVQFTIQLGRSAYVNDTGDVSSSRATVTARSPSNNVAEIHEASADAFSEFMQYDDLYTAWVETFGEKTILSDYREEE